MSSEAETQTCPAHIEGICGNVRKYYGLYEEQDGDLVGGLNPFEKYARQIGSFPHVGVKIKNVWNHHLVMYWYNISIYVLLWSRQPKKKKKHYNTSQQFIKKKTAPNPPPPTQPFDQISPLLLAPTWGCFSKSNPSQRNQTWNHPWPGGRPILWVFLHQVGRFHHKFRGRKRWLNDFLSSGTFGSEVFFAMVLFDLTQANYHERSRCYTHIPSCWLGFAGKGGSYFKLYI